LSKDGEVGLKNNQLFKEKLKVARGALKASKATKRYGKVDKEIKYIICQV